MTLFTHHDSRGPDFLVVGLQKSGSQWVTAILDAHPEINCFPSLAGQKSGVGQGHFFDILGSIDEDGGERFRNSFSKKHYGYFADLVPFLGNVSREGLYRRFRERYNTWCDFQRTKRLVGEKTVEYVFHLDLIGRLYPGIKKLCILRDPRDRIVSYHFHQLRKKQKPEGLITDEFIDCYLERVRREYESILGHAGSLCCFTYESLAANPIETVAGILGYLSVAASGRIIGDIIKAGGFARSAALDRFFGSEVRRFRQFVYILFRFLGRMRAHAIAARAAHRFFIIKRRWFDALVYSRARAASVPMSHYRKGVAGDWRNHLTEAQSARIDSALAPLHQKIANKYQIDIRYSSAV